MKPALLPLMLGASLLVAAPSREMAGPTLPPIKGVSKVSTAPIWVAYGVRATLRNMPGATVVVEDTMPDYFPRPMIKSTVAFGSVFIRLNRNQPTRRELNLAQPPVYIPDGANPMIVMAGGNVVHRMF